MSLLNDKTAVVTGGSSGIGFAAARRLADEGAKVFITGRRQPELDAAVDALGHGVVCVRADVTSAQDLDRLYATVAEHGRGLDILFANAGITAVSKLADVTDEHLDLLFDTNLKGVVHTVRKALPLLNDHASVILNSSTVASRGREGMGIYAATKAAVRSFARTWANELRHRSIRVNAVVPGTTATPGLDTLASQLDPTGNFGDFQSGRIAGIPLGRLAHPEEVANAVLFLASNLSSFTTGAEIPVEGGADQI